MIMINIERHGKYVDMSQQSQYSIRKLFEAYIYYRQQGASPEFALGALKQLRPVISDEERNSIIDYIRRWESGDGKSYPPRQDANITPWSPEITASKPSATPPNQATTKGTRQLSAERLGNQVPTGAIVAISVVVKGHEQQPVVVNVSKQQQLVMGRSSADSVLLPDIDLARLGAEEAGVSRVHATLVVNNGVVTITDMNSSNHTFLNGERVYPEEVRVVPEGAELRLGRLYMLVHFRRLS